MTIIESNQTRENNTKTCWDTMRHAPHADIKQIAIRLRYTFVCGRVAARPPRVKALIARRRRRGQGKRFLKG